MSPRIPHAARFALPNLVAILVAGLAYELFVAYVRRAVPAGLAAGEAVAANMGVWALLAAVIALVTFLLHLSDVVTRLPGWGFAWLGAAWVAVASLLVVHALEGGRVNTAVAIGVVATLLWVAVHRRIPGWPGAATAEAAERDLP